MTDSRLKTALVTVGDKVIVTITDIAFGGEGVARVEDFVVFVPFVMLEEEVEVEIIEVKKNFARARLLRLLKASLDRVQPECRYFGECGGCQYQHIAYGAQLRLKHKQVCDLLQRIGGVAASIVDPVVPCPQPYGYRNRIMVRSQWNKPEQRLNLGFLRHDNRLVVDIAECKIAEPVLNVQLQRVRANPPPRGGLKVVLRVAPEGWEVPKDSFFQNNFPLLPKLVEVIRGRLQAAGTRFLVDAYCGVGFFSVELGDLVERFVGIELDGAAIQAARKNALQQQRANGEFVHGNVEALLPVVLTRLAAAATSVVIDPPRTGCHPETLQRLRQARPAQVIYVSCHPATLARDLNALCADGVYEVVKVALVDMFPQTQHIECVADLRLKRVGPTEPPIAAGLEPATCSDKAN